MKIDFTGIAGQDAVSRIYPGLRRHSDAGRRYLKSSLRKIVIHQEDMDGDAIRQTVEIHFNFNNQADKVSLIRK